MSAERGQQTPFEDRLLANVLRRLLNSDLRWQGSLDSLTIDGVEIMLTSREANALLDVT